MHSGAMDKSTDEVKSEPIAEWVLLVLALAVLCCLFWLR
jgi:hypothetical protein